MTSRDSRISKGHCPNCGPNRNAYVVAQHEQRDETDDGEIWVDTSYEILKCGGCDTTFVKKTERCSEDIDTREDPLTGEWKSFLEEKVSFWPAPAKREVPDWAYAIGFVDSDLSSLFNDIYVALDNDLRVLAAIGARTAFDRASELLGVDPAKTFAEKLDALKTSGKIGEGEKDHLAVLADAGSAAAHRGWKPKLQELNTMMSMLEHFLYRNFVLSDEVKNLKSKVPPKPKRIP